MSTGAGRFVGVGSLIGTLVVVVAEFAVLTGVYHLGDGADRRYAQWARLDAAEQSWHRGDPSRPVLEELAELDAERSTAPGDLGRAARAWAADPSARRFTDLRTATVLEGQDLSREQTTKDREAALIFALLLVLASVGWFLWFRRVVRRQRELERALTETQAAAAGERRLTALVRNSVDLVVVVDPDTTVSFASPSAEAVLGREPAELIGRPVSTLVDSGEVSYLRGLLTDTTTGDHAVTLRVGHTDGRALVLEGTLTNLLADPSVNGWVLTVRDVTDRLALERELTHQALHDSLTGLANRQLFSERLSHALRARAGEARTLVVLFMDFDDFKNINDSLGHGVGDQMLVEFARRLESTVRAEDTAARFGGDEFAVLMEDCDVPTAQAVAERLARHLTQPVLADDRSLAIRVSIGLASALPGETTADELLRNADVAMYFAKDRGKGTVAVYDSQLHAAALHRLQVSAELGSAISGDELVLHYQPAYHLGTGRIDGFEGLLRWQHPERGLLMPDTFIEIAEQSGMVIPIGRWVLREACRAAAADLRCGEVTPVIAVNISARQVSHAGFYEDVTTALDESGLSPHRLVLEITESILLDDGEEVVDTLSRLRNLGVRVAVDDFGTGYSSLSYLADLPVDILKIDKSFVDQIGEGGDALAEAILGLSRSLGLVSVAEGVEEESQAAWLAAAGCEVGQGFLWSRAVPLSQARVLLAEPIPVPATLVGRRRREVLSAG